jgi:FixJ family two-component response regulator
MSFLMIRPSGPRCLALRAELLLHGRTGLPVRYLSGDADHAIVRNGQLDPDTGFLAKPFPPEALLRRVRQVLDQRAAADAVAGA